MGCGASAQPPAAQEPAKQGSAKPEPVKPEPVGDAQRAPIALKLPSDVSELVARHEAIRREGTAAFASFPTPTTSAYLPNMKPGKMHEKDVADDEATRQHWSKLHVVLPPYQRAAGTICVDPALMVTTVLMRHLRDADNLFSEDLERFSKAGKPMFDKVLLATIRTAYKHGSDDAARRQADVLSGQNIFDKVCQVYGNLEPWKQPYFAHAIKLLGEVETDSGAIIAKLSEVCDRALHCPHVQIKSFGLVVGHSYRLILFDGNKGASDEEGPEESSHESYSLALRRFFEFFEDFLDDHKENAFNAAFMEPARFFWSVYGDSLGLNNVDTHGSNWYIAMLNSALSVHVPIMSTYWDGCERMVVDYWAGFRDEVWEAFKEPTHFGNSFRGVPALKAGKALCSSVRPGNGQMPNGYGGKGRETAFYFEQGIGKPKIFANTLVRQDWVHKNEQWAAQIALYLERFALFFSRDYFVRKAFEVLHAEFKPEHVGFRKACATLFRVYRAEQGVPAESIAEYVYKDDMFTELDLDNAEKFFVWTGVLRPSETCELKPGADPGADQQAGSAEEGPGGQEGTDAAADGEEAPVDAELARISAQIQQAMKERDTAAIRRLMQERSQLQQQRAAQQGQAAEEPAEETHVTLLRIASNRSQAVLEQIARQSLGEPAPAQPAEGDAQPALRWGKSFKSLAMVSADIMAFIDQYIAVFAESMGRPSDFRAAIFERWQCFEVDHNTQPDIILRVAQMVAGDERYQSTLASAVAAKSACLRDTAGMTLRFYGMWKDGELELDASAGSRLEEAFEVVMEPLEREGGPEGIEPQAVGALYMQAVMPWMCASNNATSTIALASAIQRIGRAIDMWWQAHGGTLEAREGFLQYVSQDFLAATHGPDPRGEAEAPPVWGSADEDPVWLISTAELPPAAEAA